MKILFTAVTIGAGFKGGEIVPTFFIGSTFGCVAGSILGLDPGFGAAVGLIALFCGVVNSPIASIILSIELFGAQGLVLFAISCGVSFMLSGYYGLTAARKLCIPSCAPSISIFTLNKNPARPILTNQAGRFFCRNPQGNSPGDIFLFQKDLHFSNF